MLTKLLPENISSNWEVIKHAIKSALPPFAIDTPDKINRIMESCLMGDLEVWVYYDFAEESGLKIKNILTTKVITDPDSNTKNLLMYSIYSYDHTERPDWEEGYTLLMEYANSQGCAAIIGYTKDLFLLKFAKDKGADVDVRFVKLPVIGD
jgi:hypothetical protein